MVSNAFLISIVVQKYGLNTCVEFNAFCFCFEWNLLWLWNVFICSAITISFSLTMWFSLFILKTRKLSDLRSPKQKVSLVICTDAQRAIAHGSKLTRANDIRIWYLVLCIKFHKKSVS